MSQLLNKTKDFVKSTKYYFRYVNKGTLSEMNLQENLVASECDSSVVVSRKKHMMFGCAHNHDSVPLVYILTFEAEKGGTYLNGVPI